MRMLLRCSTYIRSLPEVLKTVVWFTSNCLLTVQLEAISVTRDRVKVPPKASKGIATKLICISWMP